MKIYNNGILIGKKSTTIGAEFHKTRGKSALLRSLVNDPLHQINWETPYYNKFIEECLKTDVLFLQETKTDSLDEEYIRKILKNVRHENAYET